MFDHDFPYNTDSLSTDEQDWDMFVRLTNRNKVRVGNATYPRVLGMAAYGDDNGTASHDADEDEGERLCECQTDTTAERVLTTQ